MGSTLHYENIHQHLRDRIAQTRHHLKIAVAWFTHKELFNDVISLLKRGVNVELVILNDTINFRPNGIDFQTFIQAGGKLFISATGKKLHHKFCLLDDHSLCTGSYNWTYQASRFNHENMIIADDPALCSSLAMAFQAAKTDAIPVEHLLRFHEMYPPQSVQQEVSDYLADDWAMDVLEHPEELTNVTLTQVESVGAELHSKLTSAAIARLPEALQTTLKNQPWAFRKLILRYHVWTETELEHYHHLLDKVLLLANETICWTPGMIRAAKFDDEQINKLWRHGKFSNLGDILKDCSELINWRSIAMNGKLQWTFELLKQYAEHLDWQRFDLSNPNLFWDEALISRFEKYINWKNFSAAENVALEPALLDRYRDRIDFHLLSYNTVVPWTTELFECYRGRLNLRALSSNPNFCWSESIIDANEHQWNWFELFKNRGMCWNVSLIRRYHQKYHKETLLNNPGIKWTASMLEELSAWLDGSTINYINGWGCLSVTDSDWKTPELLQRFSRKLYLGYVCGNTTLDWHGILRSPLAERFLQSWRLPNTIYVGVEGLANNPKFPWNNQLVEQHIISQYNNTSLLITLIRNKGFFKSRAFIDHFAADLNFGELSGMADVEWSADLLQAYTTRWDWAWLSSNSNLPWDANMLFLPDIDWGRIADNEAIYDRVIKPSLTPLVLQGILGCSHAFNHP